MHELTTSDIKLIDEALIRTIFQQIKSPRKKVLPEIANIVSLHGSGCVLPQILGYYTKVLSIKEKSELNLCLSNIPLYKEAVQAGLDYGILNEGAQSFNSNVNSLGVLLGVFAQIFGTRTLADFNTSIWLKVKDGLTEDYTPRQGVAEKFINSARHLSRILKATIADDESREDYSIYIGSPRGKYTTTTTRLKLEYPQYLMWVDSFRQWLDTLVLKSTKEHSSAFSYFVNFLIERVNITDPSEFFLLENKPDFYEWLVSQKGNFKVRYSRIMYDFSIWYLQENLSDTEDGNYTTIGYPLFSLTRINNITKIKDTSTSQRNNESVKQSMPTKWIHLCKQILMDDDFKWPKSLEFEYYSSGSKLTWCPSITILFLIMLELPLRKIQVVQLDSGEGDQLKYDNKRQKWISNPLSSAGHWKKIGARNINRGVLRQQSLHGDEVSLYINTNKTQDRDQGFSDSSGYVIPWHNKTVIELVTYLRSWQEKNNSQTLPTRYKDLPQNTFSTSPTKSAVDLIPDRFYLFRSPCVSSGADFAPPADYMLFRFWYHLMDELEKRLQALGESIEVVTKRNKNGSPTGAIFTPHGLRVAGLTAFLEAGVPIEVLSKIVAGHASILMTLHYIKYNNAHISNVLSSAQIEIENNQQTNYVDWLKNASWNDAQKYSIFNNPETFAEQSWDSNNSSTLWENRQIGLCPNSGTRCSEGGSLVRRSGSKNKDVYGPVEGGEGNCIMCRFFVTGTPWLIPLWLKTNSLLTQAQRLSVDLDKTRQNLEQLTKKRYAIKNEFGAEAIPASLQSQIKQHEGLVDTKTKLVDKKLLESHSAYKIVQKVRSLVQQENQNALVEKQNRHLGKDGFTEISEFRKLDMLVHAGRLYPSMEDESYEKDRNHFIDTVMFNSGLTPITLSNLSDDEKKIATDAAGKYLTTMLNDHELKLLETNAINLRELGYKESFIRTIKNSETTHSVTHRDNGEPHE